MLRKVSFLAAVVLVLVCYLSGHSQDSPSLGDLASQAQLEKSRASAPKVITNDDLLPTSGPGSLGPGETGISRSKSKPGAASSMIEDLGRLELFLQKLDVMDRATLVKFALQGDVPDFPGRSKWEKRLFAAKQAYISHARDFIRKAKQWEASAQNMPGNPAPDDPRTKDLDNKLKEIIQDGVRTSAEFQEVVFEGRDLALQSSPR